MNGKEYQTQYDRYAALIERRMEALCDVYLPADSRLAQAARYSLLGGGKRVRAVLLLAACAQAGGDIEAASDFAVALEMLHCYSLIHDDLPCMDNDDYRRGRPSCHKQFDEHTALLAADALVTAAFEAVANTPLPAERCVSAAKILSKNAGDRGMLFGQELDKEYETHPANVDQLLNLHRHKTGALILAAVQMGCAAAGASENILHPLEVYASELGLVFQIVDDILDVTSTLDALGKPVGSDAANDKTTFITLYGIAGAQQMAEEHNAAALTALQSLQGDTAFLTEMAHELLNRKK